MISLSVMDSVVLISSLIIVNLLLEYWSAIRLQKYSEISFVTLLAMDALIQYNGDTYLFINKINIMDSTIQSTEKVQQVLKYTYGLVPIVAGLDKFTNLLSHWSDYLGTSVTSMLPFSA